MLVQAVFILGSLLSVFAIGIDGALYLLQRQQVSHALLESLRQHTRTHMHPGDFAQQFKHELQKLGVPQPRGWPHSWHAEQLSPTDADFQAFRDPLIERQLPWPYPAINHHYQRQQQYSAAATPTGQDIYQANTLHLLMLYAYQPLNPVVRALLTQIHSLARHPYTRHLLSAGQLPIILEIRMPYASHPVAWPGDPALPYYRQTRADGLTPAPDDARPGSTAPGSPPTGSTNTDDWHMPWRPPEFEPIDDTAPATPPAQSGQISHPPGSCPGPPVPAPR